MATNGDTAEVEVRSQVTTSKQVTKQTKTEETNKEIQNGEADTEAELTVQLPQKKSAAKTETKVEIVKKTLPDGGVQEIKTTTTTTTIDGRTEIKTRTETKTIPKETEEEFEEEEEEFEEEESGNLEEKKQQHKQKIEEIKQEIAPIIEIEQSNAVITKEERSESTTTKKVVVSSTTENTDKEVEEEEEVLEEEEEEEEESNEVNESNPSVLENEQPKPQENVEVEDELEEVVEEEEEEIEDAVEDSKENVKNQDNELIVSEKREDVASLKKEEKYTEEPKKEVEDEEEVEEEEEEYEEAEEDVTVTKTEAQSALTQDKVEVSEEQAKNTTSEIKEVNEKEELKVESQPHQEEKTTSKLEPIPEPKPTTREVPILFDKVEDIEIKPIGPASEAISRTRTESTEIITSKDNYGGPISTQTELHRVENIVVQNRITKTLDQSYEQLTQQGLPTVKTYFVPPREPVSISPQPSKPFQSSYTDPNERRHSLLLDRLSVDRQIPPPEQYQVYNNSTFETQNLNHEPQSEVLTVSNVKPSMITNQQWYQQTNKENVIYNNVPPSTPAPSQQQYQPQATTQPQFQAPTQPQYQAPAQPQYQAPTQPQYQAPTQPQYQAPTQPQYRAPAQPQYQASTQPQHHAPTQPQYQAPAQPQYQIPSQQIYQERTQPQYQTPTQPLYQTQQVPQYQPPQAPQYQPQATTYQAPQPSSFTTSNYSKTSNSFQQNSFPSYTPTPSDWANHDLPSLNTQSQYTFQNKESTESYKEDTQQYSSSYVPPPWEQDSSAYVSETPQQYYQPLSQNQTQNTAPEPGWKPAKAQAKFSKPPPTAYVPPAPNQSFVKPVTKADTPRLPGRKTYYSEYERRYISVPETMYVPAETKYQPQPDPSPQYYYDNDEAAEKEEHAWRKELREFTEKSSQTQYSTDSVRPPWEEQQVYPKTPATPATYTPTPTWSQTLRPRSGRERTFESDYGSQEWPKSNTTSRARPLSTYAQSNVTRKVERTRGVSVDRYNPNSYKSPTLMEHPPVQSHTLTPASAPPIKFHANPQVPAYHNSRASAEPREQSETYQQNPRSWGDSRASPLQSRSFKYLQWITGTDE